ncbi:sulfatase-like hydrolase/transferase [Bradymonas sediminis]|uniref:Arylsulfatase n=1 Tax=Bradymonas sediminis TaxID=1548548 RepID=A0A2Z4FGE2_9DELT|nr:sulfatase-like hydrolase/transferase [Bradymonas sediminis]AWV88031.1 arylsulfatase [Bradymonas sediminis]TDP77154.1 arylsulfatase [Bradymonas sediminis]
MVKKRFQGRIALDARDAEPDWSAYSPPKARDGAPNILYIVWDDVGFGAFDCYGGLIETPNMTRIADMGLRYTQFHTTALCSPTRACLLTGRNATSNGMACISEFATGYPGSNGRIPFENAMLQEVLVDEGYSTYHLGKWHLTPDYDNHAAGSRRQWPLGRGFERFYGFLGGETNQWYPLLIQDNQSVDQPYLPEDGYHFTKDITDKALQYIRDARAVEPDKPWMMYFAPGCGHAPHHVPKEWADKYKGKFDMGYEAYRKQTLARQIKMGLVPKGTKLPKLNEYMDETSVDGKPWPEQDVVRPWKSLSADEKKLFSRMAEVYAGFVSHCDHHIGRILDHLEATGELDNTIIVAVSDNGASGEGGPNGTVNEMKFFNGIVDTTKENLKYIDELGSPKTYNHYPNGWAQAFCAPFKMYKRYANYEGGTADPLLVAWPKGIKARGEIRHQYCHAIDIVPTIYDCMDIDPPDVVHGYTQSEIEGVSFAHTFDHAEAKTNKRAQFYSMLGTRSIWYDGWHASAVHPATSGWGNFEQDRWELFNLEKDRSQTKDLAEKYPAKLEEMKNIWAMFAGRYNALPLDDRTAVEVLAANRPQPGKPRTEYVYYPHTEPVPQGVGASTTQRSYDIAAEVTVDKGGQPDGVIFAQGSNAGGHTLYVKGGRLHYVYNWLGELQQKISATKPLKPGKHTVGVSFEIQKHDDNQSPIGPVKLFIDGKEIASDTMKTQPGFFGLEGVITVGRDVGSPASDDYSSPDTFQGGVVEKVTIGLKGMPYQDPDMEAQMAHRRD